MKAFSPSALVRFREEKGLTQSAFAKTAGVARQNVSQWEKGDVAPTTSSLLKIVNAFRIPTTDIFFT